MTLMGGEGGQHRIAALVVEAAGREHSPRRLFAALPVDLEFIDRIAVGQALEKACPHGLREAGAPGVVLAARQPGLGRAVGMQHLVVGHGSHHHGDGKGLHQLALGLGSAGAGGQLLLHQAVAIQLGQHVVEGSDQAANLVAAAPPGAAGVVGSPAHGVGHRGQRPQGPGNLAGHQVHQAQNATQQGQRRAQVQPHAGKQAIDPALEQAIECLHAGLPGHVQRLHHFGMGLFRAGPGDGHTVGMGGRHVTQGSQKARVWPSKACRLSASDRCNTGPPATQAWL